MALNFPSNPNINDTYSYNNKDYIWNGSVWLLVTTIAFDFQSTVVLGELNNNDLLIYNSTNTRWENKTFEDLDLLTAATAASIYQPIGNYATLTDGKISTEVLPALAITDTYVVTNESEMLALNAEVGDVAIRTDVNKTFILGASPALTLVNWKEILTPGDGVLSISGSGGIITSGTSNVTVGVDTNYKLLTISEYNALTSTTTYTATIATTDWTGSSAPYTKAVTVSGILSTDNPIIDLDLSSATYSDVASIQTNWGKIYRAVTSTDTITFYTSEVPTIALPIQIKVVR